MSWIERLFQPSTKRAEVKTHSQSAPGLPTTPTVKLHLSTLSESVKSNLRRNIELIDDLGKKDVQHIYEAALRDSHVLFAALMTVEGMSKGRAAEIALSLHSKAKAQTDRERQASLGITAAIWLYSNAPCMRNPSHPAPEEVQQDTAHRMANGKRFEITKGLFVDGKWTWPGVEDECRCFSRAILPFPFA